EASGAKPTGGDDPLNNPKLENFVEIPTFFRWLHEWGNSFCFERAKRLAQIKVDCTQGGDKCSGYGENCEDQLSKNSYDTVADLECPKCAKHCSFYRKWIERKKDEFTKQGNAYDGKKKKYEEENDSAQKNNGFCETLTTYTTAAKFLENLGSCKKDSGEGNGRDKLDFSQPNVTFKDADNCNPCSEFKINCKNGKCSADRKGECNRITTIDADYIKNKTNSTEEVVMRVSDNGESRFENDLSDCNGAGIFKGIKKDVWKCGKVCGYEVCIPEKGNREKENAKNTIIQIRALVTHWVQNFLEDYNKIRTKLKPCMNNSDGSPCIDNYDKKYTCVNEWIEKKRTEWKKIKEHYLDKNTHGDRDIKTLVKNILSGLYPQTEVLKAIKPCDDLNAFENSIHCNGTAGSKKSEEEKKKGCCSIGEPCDTTPLDDEEPEPLEETEENQVKPPEICPKPPEEPKETCEAAVAPNEPEEEKKEKEKEEQEEEEPEVSPPATPKSLPKKPKKRQKGKIPPKNVRTTPIRRIK
ncbi:hypothetical protein PFAG_01877, partial [Plasmodium falciparum Santa Lucia]